MKVALANTFENNGGAAIACNRLMKALQKEGIEVSYIVRDKSSNNPNVLTVNSSFLKKKINFVRFVWERLCIFICNKFNKKNLFAVSIANTGNNITQIDAVKEADIIHLHWTCQGLLSLKNIKQLIETGKPIVWTMHDMWAFTGICHYAGICSAFTKKCGSCPVIGSKSNNDLSTRIFNKKKNLYKNANITLVGCSRWIANCAKQSTLTLNGIKCTSIPNPIDTDIYKKQEKNIAREKLKLPLDKKIILFGSIKITDERKGAQYMIDACNVLAQQYPAEILKQITLVIFGKNTGQLKPLFPFNVHCLEYISNIEDIVALYNSADVLVVPSLEDNLPNTIMEALACGTPCIGFNTGGIPEMIDHKENGYISEYKSINDLAKGINWVLFESDYEQLSLNSRQKVIDSYSEKIVAKQYINLYKILINKK